MSGGPIASRNLLLHGDNSFQILQIEDAGVARMEITLAHSGAVVELSYTIPGETSEVADADSEEEALAAPLDSELAFTYLVTNPGDTQLANVVVTDDNATPGNAADDFNPDPVLNGQGFNVGDTDQDNRLDPGESWEYGFTKDAGSVDGAFSNIATATGTPVDAQGNPIGDDVADDDAAFYTVGEPLAPAAAQTATGLLAGAVVQSANLNTSTLAFDAHNPARYQDADGEWITIALKGPGSGEVVLSADDPGDALRIRAWDTTSASSLSIKTGRGADTSVVDIVVDGSLSSLVAKTTDLLGDLTVSGTLKKLQLDDVADGHVITVGPAANARDTLTVTMDRVADLTFDSQTPIKSFTVSEWLDTDGDVDQLMAPWVKTLKSKGNKSAPGVDGDFEAGLVLSGVDAAKYTLRSAKIHGDLGSGDPGDPVAWDITGDVGTINASKGTVEGWTLDLHSDIKTLKLGVVEQAEVTIGDEAPGSGRRGYAKTISAYQWNQGAIIAGAINSLTTKTNGRLAGADGDFGATLTLSGAAGWNPAKTLNKARIAGAIAGTHWDILVGNIGSITAGIIADSAIRAGVDPALPAGGPLDLAANFSSAPSKIGSVTVKGRKGQAKGTPTFMNSIIAAWELGKIKLGVVDTDSGGLAFGLASHTIKSIAGQTETEALPKSAPFFATVFDDFRLVLVS